jgi:hypothetical protein
MSSEPFVVQRLIGKHTVTILLPGSSSEMCLHELQELAACLRGVADHIDKGIAMAAATPADQRRGPPS